MDHELSGQNLASKLMGLENSQNMGLWLMYILRVVFMSYVASESSKCGGKCQNYSEIDMGELAEFSQNLSDFLMDPLHHNSIDFWRIFSITWAKHV